eukprot:TRINITY_DN3797_c0_g1_i1.p1 TRINITY_DN3797_c0_g1~~TRINITY_DN3797_c0_g1_i1.p1  ORF type:complete len:269 (-),score=35.14 TRINITY_DN3797_c0_g1_i1:778-1584(-)
MLNRIINIPQRLGIRSKTIEDEESIARANKRRKTKLNAMAATIGTLESGRITNWYFHQWRMKEIGGLIFSVIAFGLSAIQYEAHYQDINLATKINLPIPISLSSMSLLILISLSAFGQMTMRVLRYRAMLNYFKKRNIYPRNATLYNTGYMKTLIFELLMILPHPNVLTQGMSITLTSPFNKKDYEQGINDILNLIQLLQVIFMVRMMLTLSYYYNGSSQRIMSLTSIEPNYMFVTKCLFKTYPFGFIGLLFITSILIFGFALRICER